MLCYVPVDCRDPADYTPLYFASDIATARQLIAAGATANVKNIHEEPPHEEADDEMLKAYLRLI